MKIVVMWLFYLFLLIPAFSNNQTQVEIVLLPWKEPLTMPLSWVVLLFTSLGVVVTILLSLIDRIALQARFHTVSKEAERLREEVKSLREMATLEREPE